MTIDPRMLAFLQAQQRLQQQSHSQQANGQYLQQQQQSLYQQQQQSQRGQQRPGGDADVASFLLQLRTNQNGEPVTGAEAEALQQLNAAAVARNAQSLQHQLPLSQAPGAANGMLQGYPPLASMVGMNHLYPGMVGFPQANPNAVNAFQNFYNPMQPQLAMQHAAQSLAPMQRPGGVIPGMNHSQVQQHTAAGLQAPVETGPTMTDEYIESLISNEVVAKKNNSKEGAPSENTSKEDAPSENADESSTPAEASSKATKTDLSAEDDMNIELVLPKDRDLIPDALFVALGQMKACRLQQSDRVGCYKTRALGFLGMCCKHCGGQPGFGRYFPNSVRSLAQTTTSQTILKHIGGKCRFCPQNVRTAVLELQRQQQHKEHLSTGRPRYGSRKIFFQKMWTRLHGPSETGDGARVVQADVTPERAREEADAAARANAAKANSLTASSNLAATSNLPSRATNETPSPVSNNNSDDEDSSPPKGEAVDLGISLKRKLAEGKNDSSDDENKNDQKSNDKKKARVSPVAI